MNINYFLKVLINILKHIFMKSIYAIRGGSSRITTT
ncbi:hypothetical protein Vsou_10600 [Vulcanisaeta souniana JCM 11219]|uniref:Uncharacterized protein n=1 Tax=Vulcanisaeta souniana JCM 11219 TaxID=1293586 RepID=A0ABN6SQ59_9CREN|nr:hypothetical protein Vsou_10600 [Vulcanisaeta souniana JCM 11219]